MRRKRAPRIFDDRVEIVLTRGKVAIVDPVDADLAQFNWTARKGKHTWYAERQMGTAPDRQRVHLHREVARRDRAIDGLEVDHRDGDGLNCRRINLRPAPDGRNQHNSRTRKDNTSGYKGVSPFRNKWAANIRLKGKRTFLGYFDTPEAGAAAYAAAAVRMHGDFARLA